jgi:hypothetical protein
MEHCSFQDGDDNDNYSQISSDENNFVDELPPNMVCCESSCFKVDVNFETNIYLKSEISSDVTFINVCLKERLTSVQFIVWLKLLFVCISRD